jgi:hypothetical protein
MRKVSRAIKFVKDYFGLYTSLYGKGVITIRDDLDDR